jgi:hypothetical protein
LAHLFLNGTQPCAKGRGFAYLLGGAMKTTQLPITNDEELAGYRAALTSYGI